jgi:hypothetical protein
MLARHLRAPMIKSWRDRFARNLLCIVIDEAKQEAASPAIFKAADLARGQTNPGTAQSNYLI